MVLHRDAFRRLCLARDLLDELREPAPSIEEVARQVAISPSHFTRQFAALFGLPPHQFRMRARLDLAKRLLAADHHSVTDVCMEVGFSSLGSFSDLFRRRVGVSPSVYRRRVRALVQVPGALERTLYPGCLNLMGALPPDAFRSFREA
jgi:AraC-like DNA-binding protein